MLKPPPGLEPSGGCVFVLFSAIVGNGFADKGGGAGRVLVDVVLETFVCDIHLAETGEDLLSVFEQLRAAGIKAGVALMKPSYPEDYRSYIEAADHVLVFAGDIGRQGSQADMLQTEKISLIKAINSNCEIGWDGGANLRTARAIARAGATVINVGSALTTAADPSTVYEDLVADIDKRGVVL